MKMVLASLAVVAVASPALAQGKLELGAGYSNFDTDGADIGALTARGTYFITPHLGVEGEASIGIDDDQSYNFV